MDIVVLFLVLCSAVHTHSQTGLLAAERRPQHTVELLVVMDKMAFESWNGTTAGGEDRYKRTVSRVADFLASVVVGINDLYESLGKYGLALDLRLKKLHILKRDLWEDKDLWPGVHNRRQQVPTDKAIKRFYAWSWRARPSVGSFDHALLLTGYDLTDPKEPDKPTQGVAYKGVMCRYGSVSVVENNSTFQLIDTVAHELGHSLRCVHDEDTQCKDSIGHVMSSRTEINSTNRWSFSPCSADDMKGYIAELNSMNANCLVKTTTAPTPGIELGALLGPDQQCQMVYGPQAFFCREFYTTAQDYTKMCSSMWCSASPNDTHCRNYIASDGFVCGDDKVCKRGSCSPSEIPLSTSVSDACPQGDQPGAVHEGLTCAEVASTQPWLCYRRLFHSKCCHACSKAENDAPGCEYGDKESWCTTSMNYPFDCYLNSNTCCKSCLQYKQEDKPGCEYGDHSQECQTKLSVPIGCYENEARCCETCAKAKSTTNPECPYGDRSTWCQNELEVPNGCYLNQDLCCGTCDALANVTMSTRLQRAESQNGTGSFMEGKLLDWCLYGDRYPEWCQTQTPFVCYNSTHREWCCQSCAEFHKVEQPGCEYGDRHERCDDLVYPYACYHQDNAKLCCGVCGMYRNASRPDCRYGDRQAWCYKLNEKYTNQQWCHLDLDNGHCCGTCLFDETAIPVFGSRVKELGLPTPK
ncbi:uncharacterized protein LOC143283667 [Babylonia areolata]|uniref:uncharacterized protein LOC143283667 n=1 Tax=Babylonia areolata TaxID=304850 RepID=UPI003FD51F08